MSEKCYSYNEEEYHTDYSAVLDNFSDHCEIGDQVEFWQGDIVQGSHERYLNTYQIIESMQEQAYEESEFSEGYLDEVNKEQQAELKKIVVEYLSKITGAPTFFTANNIEKVEGWWNGEDVQLTPINDDDGEVDVSNIGLIGLN